MSERPFMQLYVSDFVGDTLALSAGEVGAYALLLFAATGEGGTLPNDTDRLRRVCRLSPAEFAEAWPSLRRYFIEDEGRLISLHLAKWPRDKARIFGRTPLSLSARQSILVRDGERCHYCGATDGPFHIDHVHPVALGGTDDPSNLVVACVPCNLSKGARTVEEWRT